MASPCFILEGELWAWSLHTSESCFHPSQETGFNLSPELASRQAVLPVLSEGAEGFKGN